MRTARGTLALLFATIAAAVSPATAAVLRVKPGAPGPVHDGTSWATAFTSIQPALDAAQPGDEVWVARAEYPYGAYTENVVLRTPDVGLYGGFTGTETARSQRWPDARTIVRANEPGRSTITIYHDATNAIVDGFQVTGGSPGIYTWSQNATIANNWITENGAPDADSGGIECHAPGPVTIVDNVITRNQAQSGAGILVGNSGAVILRNVITENSAGGYLTGGAQGGGIEVASGAAVIRDNVIAHNAAVDYTTYAAGQGLTAGGGITIRDSYATVANNTIADNLCAGQGRCEGGGLYVAGVVTVANNIIANNMVAPIGGQATLLAGGIRVAKPSPYGTPDNVQVHHNLFFNNAPDDGVPTGANANVHADPGFTNTDTPYALDYRIRSESPAIDAGDNAAVPPGDTDLGGGPRLLGASVDLGAYESQITATIPTLTRVYVRSGADDRNDGTSWATAKRSIGAAISVAAPGAEVWVATGLYPERIALKNGMALLGGFGGSEINRREARPWAQPTVIDARHRGTAVTIPEGAVGTTVDGFTIRNGGDLNWTWRETYGGGILCRGDQATITRNILEGNTAMSVNEDGSVAAGGGLYAESVTATIANNTIRGNRAYAVAYMPLPNFGSLALAEGGGLALVNVNATVANNLIEGNRAETSGNVAHHWSWGAGLYAVGCTGLITNNTFVGNGLFPEAPNWEPSDAMNGSFFLDRSQASLKVANNIVAFNGGGIERSEDNATLSHNDVYGNGRDSYGPDPTGANGNISADPLFVNRAAGDYHLISLSPCVNAGDNAATWGETDLDRLPRVLNWTVDMGAYETVLFGPYTLGDAAGALRVAAGFSAPASSFVTRLNVVDPTTSGIDLLDAVRLARRVAGLEPNP